MNQDVSTISPPLPPLYMPALQCKMGDWTFYATSLPLREVALRITSLGGDRSNDDLEALLQRERNEKKVDQISDYLRRQGQRFFNSLVISVDQGAPQWLDLELGETPSFPRDIVPPTMLAHINDSIGILMLTGTERLFAIDGQHRVEGIKKAIGQQESIGGETMSVLFVHDDKEAGRERIRRMFTTLNRHATKVNEGEIIALDEDDAFAITTRRLLKENQLLKGERTSERQRTSLDVGSIHFTTPQNVYKISKLLCGGRRPEWAEKEMTIFRPKPDVLDAVYKESNEFWMSMAEAFPAVGEVTGDNFSFITSTYRNSDGGNLLFRPIGQSVLARAVRALCDAEPTLFDYEISGQTAAAVREMAKIGEGPLQLHLKPWKDLLWNNENKSMIVNAAHEHMAARLWCYMIGRPMKVRRERKLVPDTSAYLKADYGKITGGSRLSNIPRIS